MSEELWPLPGTWQWRKAGDVAQIVGGGTPPASDESNFDDRGTPWLTPADLTGYQGVYIASGRRGLSKKGLASCGARLLPAGTVLYSSRAPIGYCAIASNPIATNQGFKSLVLADGLLPEFVRYYLLASKEYAESLASGTTFKELSGSRIAEMLIPVPPVRDQERIVANLDSLVTHSKTVREELARIPRLVERYKQAILAAAFQGDLSSQWRASSNYPSALTDLKQSLHLRKETWVAARTAKKRSEAKYSEPIVEAEERFAIPGSWCFATVDQLSYFVTDGEHATPPRTEEGIFLLSARNVQDGFVSLEKVDFISQRTYAELSKRLCVRQGDVLLEVARENETGV